MGVPCDYYPWCIGPHCTGPSSSPGHDLPGHGISLATDHTSPSFHPPDMGPQLTGTPLLETSSGHHWRSAKTCSLQDPTSPHQWGGWHLVAIEANSISASRQYASYWNAFLFALLHVILLTCGTYEHIMDFKTFLDSSVTSLCNRTCLGHIFKIVCEEIYPKFIGIPTQEVCEAILRIYFKVQLNESIFKLVNLKNLYGLASRYGSEHSTWFPWHKTKSCES